MTRILVFLILSFFFTPLLAQGAKSPVPLFSKGAETFLIKDKSGKTPQFQVLDDSPSEKALASMLVTFMNADPKVQPKIPTDENLKLKVESLELAPSVDGPNQLVVSIKLSGREVELNRPVDKAKLLSGAPVTIDFPQSSKNLALFEVQSSGRLKMRLDKATNNLIIDEARAKSNIKMSGVEGAENISFTGRGLRQAK